MVFGIVAVAAAAWCGWASGFHRTTVAAETTWLVTLAAVVLFDVWLWRQSSAGPGTWLIEQVGEPWPPPGRGGRGPALRGVAPWVALLSVVLGWEALGIDSGPHQYHLTISALAQAYRPLNAALLLVWLLVGIGYEVARVRRTPTEGMTSRGERAAGPPDRRGAFVAVGSLSTHHGSPALLLPQSPPVGLAFWVLVPCAAVLLDRAARHSGGRYASAEEFIRFISTTRIANAALIVAWTFAGYHLFAR